MRNYILSLTLLFGPLILLFLYLHLSASGKRARAAGKGGWKSVAYALGIGAVLNLLVVFAIVLSTSSEPGARDLVYKPQHVDENGKIVPGRMVPREEMKAEKAANTPS
jgi:hypothetical protein